MVGAIVLYVIALSAGLSGMLMFIKAETPEAAVQGLVLCLIGAVCLSGALIIDGVRHYASKLSVQLGYLLKPGSVFANNAAGSTPPPTVTATSATQSGVGFAGRTSGVMRSYQVIGKDQNTGRDTELVVNAFDETEALRAGEKRGLDVKRVALAN